MLGLGALVTAFPYMTPPPEWMPEILALLASRAANDAGAIGKTVKVCRLSILVWHIWVAPSFQDGQSLTMPRTRVLES